MKIVNRIRKAVSYSFAKLKPPGRKKCEEQRTIFLEKQKKTVLPQSTLCLETHHFKQVDFTGKTISFTCQLVRKQKKLRSSRPVNGFKYPFETFTLNNRT